MKFLTKAISNSGVVAVAILTASTLFVSASHADDADALREEVSKLRTQVEEMSVLLKELEPTRARITAATVSPDEINVPPAIAAAAAGPVTFSGEVRIRAEVIDEEGMERRDRDRVRARAGVTVRVTDDVTAVTRISTGGRDPRASNATLTGESAKKDVDLDLAYVQWQLRSGMTMSAGKMSDSIWRPIDSPLLSAEVTPEGWAATFGNGDGWFGGLARFWLEERPAGADSARYVAQLGYDTTFVSKQTLRVAASYQDFSEVQFRKPFFDGVSSYGNSLLADGSLANDFDVVGLAAQFDARVLLMPFRLFVDVARNVAADSHRDAASIGVALGDHTAPRGWQIAYHYTWLEKDALFAQIVNAEYGNGNTDTRGHGVKITYAPAKNWTMGLALSLNDLNVDVEQQHMFKRAQFDLSAKY